MPEGPTLLLLREEAAKFAGRKVLEVAGNSRLPDIQRMRNKTVRAVRTWGKHFLLEFDRFSLRIHFLLFGSYRIDELKENASPRLSLRFANGDLHFYASSVRFIEQPLDEIYDWSADVLSDAWDPAAAKAKLQAHPDWLACDALLDQQVFSGVGNIIKNEVLYRIRVHPLSTVGALPEPLLDALVEEARNYSFDFLAWRRVYLLTKNLLVHRRSVCPSCGGKIRLAELGRTRRRAFWCDRCQPLYGGLAVQPEPMYAPRRRKRPAAAKKAAVAKKAVAEDAAVAKKAVAKKAVAKKAVAKKAVAARSTAAGQVPAKAAPTQKRATAAPAKSPVRKKAAAPVGKAKPVGKLRKINKMTSSAPGSRAR